MRGASQAALTLASERFEPILANADGAALADQLFGVVDILAGSGALRRNFTDPARAGQDKAGLATALLRGKVDDDVVDLMAAMVQERWSDEEDLAEALELLAIDAALSAAEHDERLVKVSDDVFRFDRAVTGNRELRAALSDRTRSTEDRAQLAKALLNGAEPESVQLIDRVVRSSESTSVSNGLARVMNRAAERRRRRLAQVTTAVPLTPAQTERLTDILSRTYDAPVTLNVGVDPAIIGGIRITIGSDVIDATVLARLADAARRIGA